MMRGGLPDDCALIDAPLSEDAGRGALEMVGRSNLLNQRLILHVQNCQGGIPAACTAASALHQEMQAHGMRVGTTAAMIQSDTARRQASNQAWEQQHRMDATNERLHNQKMARDYFDMADDRRRRGDISGAGAAQQRGEAFHCRNMGLC